MDLFNRKELTVRRSHQTAVWTFTDEGLGESVAEIFIRCPDGLYYLRERFVGTLPDPANLYHAAYLRGIQSPRPYHVNHIHDASTFYCAIALYITCCKAWNLDARELISHADPRARVSDFNLLEIKEHARWERAVFPGTWNTPAIEALTQALSDVDCSTLASVIRQRTIDVRGY